MLTEFQVQILILHLFAYDQIVQRKAEYHPLVMRECYNNC